MWNKAINLRYDYCNLRAEEKWKYLKNETIEPEVVAELFQMTDDEDCSNEDSSVILDLDENEGNVLVNIIEQVVLQACDSECKNLKAQVEADLAKIEEKEEKEALYWNHAKVATEKFTKLLTDEGGLLEFTDNLEDKNKITKKLEDTVDKLFGDISNDPADQEKIKTEKKKMKDSIKKASEKPGKEMKHQIMSDSKKRFQQVSKKAVEAIHNKNKVNKTKSKVKKHFKTMSKSDGVAKTANAVSSVVGAVPKFTSGNALEVVSGVLDIATAILDFAPPPFSIIAGITSNNNFAETKVQSHVFQVW